MNIRRTILTAVVTGIILLGAGSGYSQQIPNLTLTALEGEQFQLKEFISESPVIINFWSLTCAPCKREMRHLDAFEKQYDNFKVVSINIDTPKSLARVKSYVRSNDYAFQVFLDPEQQIFQKLGGRLMPYSIFVDQGGAIISRQVGYAPGDEKKYAKTIESLTE